MYKFKKIVGRSDFSDQFRLIIIRYKRNGYNMNFMRRTACLVVNPITVNNFADLFNCTPVGRASDLMFFFLFCFVFYLPQRLSVKLAGAWRSVFGRAHRGSTVGLLLLQRFRLGLLLSTRLASSQWWILIYMFTVLIHWWVESFTRTEQLLCVYEPQRNLGWGCSSVKPV